jgi:hypothetical protein
MQASTLVSGERAPGRRWGMSPQTEGGEAPTGAGAERRTRWPPCGWACPFSGRERPAHNADRLAFRRFTAAFFLRPRDRLLETDRGGLYGTPLIPQAFTRVHPLPPARCRADPHSWAGRCLPRPPEVRLRRPNPQAPHPPRSHASHENALGRVDRTSKHQAIEQIKNISQSTVKCPWRPRPERDHPCDRDCFVALRAPRNDNRQAIRNELKSDRLQP